MILIHVVYREQIDTMSGMAGSSNLNVILVICFNGSKDLTLSVCSTSQDVSLLSSGQYLKVMTSCDVIIMGVYCFFFFGKNSK